MSALRRRRHTPSCSGRDGEEKELRRFAGRFGIFVVILACSCREDLVWIGGNVGCLPFFAFFMKRQLDLSFVDVRLRGRPVWFVR
ncbi:hypothetical protein Taro_028606, partial [Colocasia esculenta]|nr:hypothetical protein [Colocasia esculenta]